MGEVLPLNAYSTLREPPAPTGLSLTSYRGLDDPETLRQLDGFAGFVTRMGGPMTQRLYSVLDHIGRTRWQFAIEADEDELGPFHAWCEAANAIYFRPDMTVLDPQGRLLMEPGMDSAELDGVAPHPADALERKARSAAILEAQGHLVTPHLPPVAAGGEVVLRSAPEAALRCMALAAVAIRGEALTSGAPMPVAALRQKLPLSFPALTPAEKAFMDGGGLLGGLKRMLTGEKAGALTATAATWRYEGMATLAWALGHLDDFPAPDRQCDVPGITRMLQERSAPSFVSEARLRPAAEILDQLDLAYRRHWVVTEARVQNEPAPQGLEPGAAYERHYALNWLTGHRDAPWDHVDTAT